MGMISTPKKVSNEQLIEGVDDSTVSVEEKCTRDWLNIEEKYITRSYFKADKSLGKDVCSQSKHNGKHKSNQGKKLAEVFRTDFITAMKIPDSQPLPSGELFTLSDPWRLEWEKGVQVPVNPNVTLTPVVRHLSATPPRKFFILPVGRIQFDEVKYLNSIDRSSTSCDYDLDDMDITWLESLAKCQGLKKGQALDEITMERAITYFERQCFEKMVHTVATKEGLSIEYDESTTCMVCLSPDVEEGNEIIFCDACNMCVHQHCYGVLEIPEGNWLCNPCSRGILSPPCCLCPNHGGAMKRIKDSHEWVHVMCAWWIPEVKIEDSKYIERITKDKIPIKRWNLLCTICREKQGACVQCTVKRCVRAYHITCAAKEGLEMKTVIVPEKDDIQHVSFCSKHCTPVPPEQSPHYKGADENMRLKELRKLESNFHTLVRISMAAKDLNLDKESTKRLHAYWTLKRKENGNTPLIKLTLDQQEKLSGKQGVVFINQQKTLEMERFLRLRQDLERLRNLCYMIVRREKVRKELHRVSMDIFYKQDHLLNDGHSDGLLRHRATKFSDFSDSYRTERHLAELTGGTGSIFDETLDDDSDLIDSGLVERFDPEDLKRDKIADKERNVFSLFKQKSCSPKLETNLEGADIDRSAVRYIEAEIKHERAVGRREVDVRSNLPEEKSVFDKLNEIIDSSCEKEAKRDERAVKKSILHRRGKKRFRNLHQNTTTQTIAESSPTKTVNSVNCVTQFTPDAQRGADNLNNQINSFISRTKRKRLNSVTEQSSLNDVNPADFIRVTRSRVTPCS